MTPSNLGSVRAPFPLFLRGQSFSSFCNRSASFSAYSTAITPWGNIMRAVSLFLAFGLLLATNASAQLASQTALVGTVTDSGGLGRAWARRSSPSTPARRTPTRRRRTRRAYYNIQFVRTGRYEITVSADRASRRSRRSASTSPTNQVVAHQRRRRRSAQLNESITVVGDIADPRHRQREDLGDDRQARGQWICRLNGRNVWSLAATTPGVLGGLNSDIGLSFRGAGQREIQNSLSLDGINSSANLLAATSMRPIADAVDGDSGPDRQHVGRVRLRISASTSTWSPRAAPTRRTDRCSSSSRTTRSISANYFDNPDDAEESRGSATSSASRWTGRCGSPKLYDGRNKTFFMAAYEGVRADTLFSPIATVPTALMRQGNFSEISTPIRQSAHRAAVSGQHHSRVADLADRAQAARLLPGAQPAGPRRRTCRRRRFRAPRTSTRFIGRGDQNIGNKIRLSVRYNWHDSVNDNAAPLTTVLPTQSTTQPRVNHNTVVSHTHTLSPNLLNDFRIGYHRVRFRYAQPVHRQRPGDCGVGPRDSRLRRRRQIQQPGHTEHQRHRRSADSAAAGTNWYQFDNDVPDVERRSPIRAARTTCERASISRRLATGRRAANDPRGRFDFTGDITRLRASPTSCSACRAR